MGWDLDIIGGSRWRDALNQQLDSARCVIVVWSVASTSPAGEFVHEEAGKGKARGVLLPVRIDPVVEPLGFGALQSVDLIGWNGDVDDPRFDQLRAAADAMSTTAAVIPPIPQTIRQSDGLLVGPKRILARYISDLLHLTLQPRRFLTLRASGVPTRSEDGAHFFFISLLLTIAISLPFARDLVRELPSDLAFATASTLLYGCASYVAWRAVGGKLEPRQVFLVNFFVGGMVKVIQTATFMVFTGLVRAVDRTSYDSLLEMVYGGDMAVLVPAVSKWMIERPMWWAAMALVVGGLAAMFGWVVIGWSALRSLAGLSSVRAAMAFMILCSLSVPIYLLTWLVAIALVR